MNAVTKESCILIPLSPPRSSFSSEFNVVEELIDYGYKELTIPANEDKTHKLSKDALHIWPRRDMMLIALPNSDKTFTCTLFMKTNGENSFESFTKSYSTN